MSIVAKDDDRHNDDVKKHMYVNKTGALPKQINLTTSPSAKLPLHKVQTGL